MTAIAPFISPDEERLLYSRWTQMRSEEDYRRIYADVERIAQTHGIRLPENLIFSYKRL
jgi:hypothetical protein